MRSGPAGAHPSLWRYARSRPAGKQRHFAAGVGTAPARLRAGVRTPSANRRRAVALLTRTAVSAMLAVTIAALLPTPASASAIKRGSQTAIQWAAGSDRLVRNETLAANQSLYSANRSYRLTMQGDGNLVLYSGSQAIWSTNTMGSGANRAILQSDGNFVVYSPSRAVWASNSMGSGADRFVVQNDRNLVIYSGTRAVWASNTYAGASAPAPNQPPPSGTCWGDYCSGKDPSTTKAVDGRTCATDAVTVASTDFTNGQIQLRWSNNCKSNWARVVVYPIGYRVFTPVPIQLAAIQDTGYRQVETYDVGVGSGTYWTKMIYSPTRKVRAGVTLSCGGVGDCVVSALTGNPVYTKWV